MKNFLINKNAETDINAYSIYENPNKELKQEIIDFVANYSPNEINIGWPPKTWTVCEKDGNEYKLESGRDVKYVSAEEVEEAQKAGLKAAVNQKFITGKHFHECFGTLYNYNENTSLSIMNITDVMDLTDTVKYPKSMQGGRVFSNDDHNHYQTEFKYKLNTYDKIEIEMYATIPGMFLLFTNDGNFENRNYNQNLNNYTNDVIHPSIILDLLKEQLRKKIGDKKISKSPKADHYFTDNMLFIPYYYVHNGDHKFGFETIKTRGDGKSYQHYPGYPIYKKPAKTIDTTVDELIDRLMELIPDDAMKFFDLEYVLNYKFEFILTNE